MNLPLLRSRARGHRKTLISSSSSSFKRRATSPYMLTIVFIFIFSFFYLTFVYTWLISSTTPKTTINNPDIVSVNHNIPVLPDVEFDAHNFLHEAAPDESKPSIIHIVHTRFMQHQPSLLHLAQARLHLFETFCLPTMVHQSSQSFLWFIQVDPELDTSILSSLIELVKPYHHFFVIATLVNYWIGPEKNGSWRNGIEATEIWSHVYKEQVYTGNLDLIVSAMQMEEGPLKPIILETRLDSDDGLHTHFIEYVQKDAIHMFTSSSSRANWLYWCNRHYLVWFYERGGDTQKQVEEKDDDLGSIELRHMREECITPGLTVGMNRRTSYEEVPQYDHNQLYQRMTLDAKECGLPTSQECIRLVGSDSDFYISAVRARTLTSAGMKDVTPRALELVESQSDLWSVLMSPAFQVDAEKVKKSRDYIQANLIDIAKENLIGQCRGKHSCKESSKQLLQKIINKGTTAR